MANVKITDMAADAAVTGVELVAVSDGGSAKKMTVDQIVAYAVDEIEAIAACATLDSGDSIMILENDTDLKPVTYEVLEDAIAETMYGHADIGALADADVILVQDNATTKGTALMSAVATYTLGKNTATIRDISGTAALAAPADANMLMVIDGTTAKKTTWTQARASFLGGFEDYTIALAATAGGADTDLIYVLTGGTTEEKMTLLQLKAYVGVSVTAVGAPTADRLAVWATATSIDDSISVIPSATGFTTGSDVAIPTTACVRGEMNDIVFDEAAMASALVNADTFLICDGNIASSQYKATLTQLKTWWEGEYQAVAVASSPTFAGMTFSDAGNLTVNATTGTKIGTAVTQKLGFWNAAPVVQQAHVADPAATAVDPDAITSSVLGDLVATNGGWGYSSEENADAVHQKFDLLIADVTSIRTQLVALIDDVQANNAAIDAMCAKDAITGLTASA